MQHDIDIVLIDNLMTAMKGTLIKENELITERNYYIKQGEFMDQLKEFTEKNNIVTMLIAHDRKGQTGTNDDISGSSEIANYATVIMGYKEFRKDNIKTFREDERCNFAHLLKDNMRLFTLTKNRFGKQKTKEGMGIVMCYESVSNRVEPIKILHNDGGVTMDINRMFKKKYNWENETETDNDGQTTLDDFEREE